MPGPPVGSGRPGSVDRRRVAVGVGAARPREWFGGGDRRIGAVLQQQLHRGDVAGVRRAPERRRAAVVDAEQIEVVLGEPGLAREARVGIGALVEQRGHQIEVRRLLLELGARLRIEHPRRPLDVEDRVERRHAAGVGQVRVGAVRQQILRDVVLAVDRGDQQRRDAIAWADRVDVGPVLDQRLDRAGAALAGREMQRGQAALRADQLVERERARDAGDAAAGRGRGAPARQRARRAADAGALRVLRVADRVLQRLFGRRDAGEIDQLRGPRRVGAVREQLADRVGAIERGGEHQRRLAVRRLGGVGVAVLLEQQLDRVGAARRRGEHQRRRAGGGDARRRWRRRRSGGRSPPPRRPAPPGAARCSRRAASSPARSHRRRAACWSGRRRRSSPPSGARSCRRPAPRSRPCRPSPARAPPPDPYASRRPPPAPHPRAPPRARPTGRRRRSVSSS